MLNYIWGFMIVIGMIVAAFNGKMEAVSTEGKKEVLENKVYSSNIRRVAYWNKDSIYGFY